MFVCGNSLDTGDTLGCADAAKAEAEDERAPVNDVSVSARVICSVTAPPENVTKITLLDGQDADAHCRGGFGSAAAGFRLRPFGHLPPRADPLILRVNQPIRVSINVLWGMQLTGVV